MVLHLWEAKCSRPHHLHGPGSEEAVVGRQGQHSHPHPITDRLGGDGVPWNGGGGGGGQKGRVKGTGSQLDTIR